MNTAYRSHRGRANYYAGKMAETMVSKAYEASGCAIKQRRWRSQRSEIDIIAQSGPTTIFIEVKRAKDFATAAQRVSVAQQKRLYDAGAEYLATQREGCAIDARFDVALVNAKGKINIIENAIGF